MIDYYLVRKKSCNGERGGGIWSGMMVSCLGGEREDEFLGNENVVREEMGNVTAAPATRQQRTNKAGFGIALA